MTPFAVLGAKLKPKGVDEMNSTVWNRRQLLRWLGRGASLALAAAASVGGIGPRNARAAEEPNQEFVAAAFAMQRRAIDAGDQSFGAVVVKDGKIVGEGPSRVITNRDATAHAEMEAIRDASRKLGSRDLSGCVMYSTFKPCPMCETAAYWAKVSQLYHGGAPADGAAPRYGDC